MSFSSSYRIIQVTINELTFHDAVTLHPVSTLFGIGMVELRLTDSPGDHERLAVRMDDVDVVGVAFVQPHAGVVSLEERPGRIQP